MTCSPRRLRSSAIPPFYPVPGRERCDGWTAQRQADFIGHLAETRSVTAAARRVQMARETAYRLRQRSWSESFRAAWDAALGKAPECPSERRKVTTAELQWRLDSGLWAIRMLRGRFVGASHKPDDSALYSLLARYSRQPVPSRAGARRT